MAKQKVRKKKKGSSGNRSIASSSARRDAEYFKELLTMVNGTIFDAPQVSICTELKGSSYSHIKSESYKELIMHAVINNLPRFKGWTVAVIHLVEDKYSKITYNTLCKEITGLRVDSPEFTDIVHDLKVKLVNNINPKYTMGVYQVVTPNVDLQEEQINGLCDHVLDLVERNRGFDPQRVSEIYRLRLLGDTDRVEELKRLGYWDDLGTLIYRNIVGYNS